MFSDAGKTFIWILVGASESFVMAFTWLIVSKGHDSIGSMTISQVITYYFYLFITWYIIGGTFWHLISNSIRRGELSNTLLKPIFPYAKDILLEQGWKTFGLISGIPILILFFLVFSGNLSIEFSLIHLIISLPSIILSTLIFALLQFIIGNLTHWFQKVDGVYTVYNTTSYIFGGAIAPLLLMPLGIQKAAYLLPFRYTFSFPIEIFQSLISNSQIYLGYFLQVLWLILLIILSRILYKKGLQKYESFGN